MNQAQQKFGEPLELVRKKISPSMNGMIREFIGQAPLVVLATANGAGDCDASPYAHCPRAFTFSKLWDTSRIEQAVAQQPNRYWLGRWKEELAKTD
jgi:predicted pyridoxine 5'-phosphate oxidase superfamily flavin-nucleotide-binding protein